MFAVTRAFIECCQSLAETSPVKLMLEFDEFVSILNSLFNREIQRELFLDRRAHLNTMVFGDFRNNNNNNNNDNDNNNDETATLQNRWQMMRMANSMKILGRGVIRVVHRLDDAKENKNLDLSDCQLMQVPDAIYFMMRNTTLKACNLSSNVITKIPPKFPSKFSLITELNLSNNRMSSLPEEIAECTQLERVDISQNSFISLPNCLLTLPALVSLDARKNFIADVDVEAMTSCSSLENVNLEENPLSRETSQALSNIETIRVTITPREVEEWEDLSI